MTDNIEIKIDGVIIDTISKPLDGLVDSCGNSIYKDF